jgi:hypothetical protein
MPEEDVKINGCATYWPVEWNEKETWVKGSLKCARCRDYWELKDEGKRCQLRAKKRQLPTS